MQFFKQRIRPSPSSDYRMQLEYDPERLIEAVSKRPGIWDYNDKDYRVKKRRMKLWNEVLEELMPSDVELLSKRERRTLELQLQKKWKGIKDNFQKYVANPKRTKRPYIYSKQLQFLLKSQKLPGPEADSDEEPDEKKQELMLVQKIKLYKHDDAFSDEDEVIIEDNDQVHQDPNFDGCPSPGSPSSSKAKPHDYESGTSHFVFTNVENKLKANNEESDMMFLMSLLPHLNSIPEEFKLNAKMELMKVLQQANHSISKLMH